MDNLFYLVTILNLGCICLGLIRNRITSLEKHETLRVLIEIVSIIIFQV